MEVGHGGHAYSTISTTTSTIIITITPYSSALSITRTLPEYGEVDDGGLEEEEDDDPVFVLTDEWKEFFAKSGAKRKLEKQQAKKNLT
ncbi:histidine-rich protein [Pyrus ussuriensis x Pyrus communis]|uniref:Histidine-rich protein n=1 Tax=Pyrus ussuriensis x Pyrus communis TaxID=2448454 RepID=A0A5N5FKE8_9ROSA|nr:histidine-rich protein [Pyrus ussuriensis x Pyrus communis]